MFDTVPNDPYSLTNVVDVIVYHILLQIRITNVGMGVVDQVKGFDFFVHPTAPLL